MAILLGAIADDFTGATDLSNILIRSGVNVVQTVGIPGTSFDPGTAEAIVVALKSRTVPADVAVARSLTALRWLRAMGARQFYFKYCSTFDSTAEGNIGPVADALLEDLRENFALICPAFPANSRTVYMGHLFVGNELLSDTSMKDHPLTPMRDSNIVRMINSQSRHRAGLVGYDAVSGGVEAIESAIVALRREGFTYAVADALSDDHLASIGKAAKSHRLITGGSALAFGLAENLRREGLLGPPKKPQMPQINGTAAVLAGSCSKATREQIGNWKCAGRASLKLDVDRIASDAESVLEVIEWTERFVDQPVLIYSSDNPTEVAALQKKYGGEQVSAAIETAMGTIANGLVDRGRRRLILAGGETAGAVVSALAVTGLKIGPEIDLGVPWTETIDQPRIALALKSGNFGGEDFFVRALAMFP
ncbi:MAG: 3-oxo-tetronate kinase [Woeseia sp.]